MFGSFDIGSFFGIRARLHWTFVVLVVVLLLAGYPTGNPWWNAATLAALIGIVILHELGHGLVARHFGLQVLDVTLMPFGGVTRMSRIPEDSKIEGWIAFAGPAVNLGLAMLALPFAPEGALSLALSGRFAGTGALEVSAGLFVLANLTLAIFNLLPAFPLDGGRIARAVIALRTDWVTATRRTAAIGKWIALAMIAWGVYGVINDRAGSPLLVILGIFLWASGVREAWGVRIRHAGLEFARAMGVPVEPAVATARPLEPEAPAPSDDPSGARRPSVLRPPESERTDRLSEAEIAALERFRGRIGRARAPD